MAKKEEEKKGQEKAQEQSSVENAIHTGNQIMDTHVASAMEEINKEKDDRKKKQAKRMICVATYTNRKTLLQLQQRRREDDITKEKLNSTKDLLERALGVECEIKDGECVPTDKKIAADKRLTPDEFEREARKLDEEIAKKISESDKKYNTALEELRNSYEGEYRWYIDRW